MTLACIDIGSNTTRLLVAEGHGDGVRELASRREFTRIGRSLDRERRMPAEKVSETVAVVERYVRVAREVEAQEVRVVATAAVREATNAGELAEAIGQRTGLALRVLSGAEEARLSFMGATRTLAEPTGGTVAVVDVGGGSTEVAVGSPADDVEWWQSFRVGSGLLADSYLHSDPPSAAELERVRTHVGGVLEGLEAPPADSAVAVGGTATSLCRLVGSELSHEALEHGVRVLSDTPIAEMARRFDLDPERARLLPAGIVVLAAVSQRLGLPLRTARGGLREGVILEAIAAREEGR